MQIDTSRRRSRIVAVLGPTNTGKTHLAMERMLGHQSGMIGFPLRLLARENYDRACAIKGKGLVALITGEEKIVPKGARYFLCTAESMPLDRETAFVGVDEVQMSSNRLGGSDLYLFCTQPEAVGVDASSLNNWTLLLQATDPEIYLPENLSTISDFSLLGYIPPKHRLEIYDQPLEADLIGGGMPLRGVDLGLTAWVHGVVIATAVAWPSSCRMTPSTESRRDQPRTRHGVFDSTPSIESV